MFQVRLKAGTSTMARFQLWDTPGASLLAETDDIREIVSVVQSFIDDVGLEGLEDFNLSDATLTEFPANNYSGQEITTILREHLAKESASSAIHS